MLSVFPKTLRRAAMTKLLFISYLSTYIYFHRYCTSDSHLIASLSRDRHMRRVTVTSSRDHGEPPGTRARKGKSPEVSVGELWSPGDSALTEEYIRL